MKPTIRRLASSARKNAIGLTHRSLDRIFDPELWASVRSIYEGRRCRGRRACAQRSSAFDGVDATAGELPSRTPSSTAPGRHSRPSCGMRSTA